MPQPDPRRVIADLRELAHLTSTADGAQRVAWTAEWRKARGWFREKVAGLGLSVEADAAGTWVNSADDPARCSFTLPARLRRDDLLVTVSSGGASPAFATWLRDEIDAWLEPAHLELLALLAAERRRMRAEGRPTAHPGWHEALRSGMLERLRDGDVPGAEELLRTCLSSPSD